MKKIVTVLVALAATSFGQGSLNPPGAPAPSMKSLLEIWGKLVSVEGQGNDIKTAVGAIKNDPRTLITAYPVLILDPGSYVLGANITAPTLSAILIAADDVTLDLNGFSVNTTAATQSGHGIIISGAHRNIHIKNGTIRGPAVNAGTGGFVDGIFCDNATCTNIVVSDVSVRGVSGDGINLGSFDSAGLVVERCRVANCGAYGIVAQNVRGCDAGDCGTIGIRATGVSDSSARSIGARAEDHGIFGGDITGCRGGAASGNGISGNNVLNSTGFSTFGSGISAQNVSNSGGSTSASGADGIHAVNVMNSTGQVFGNGTSAGTSGIFASGTVSYSRGFKLWGWAISAPVTIGCTVEGGGIVNSPSKHLGTP